MPADAIDGTPVVVVFLRMPVARLDKRVLLMRTTVVDVPPSTSPVCVALDTRPLYCVFVALSPVFVFDTEASRGTVRVLEVVPPEIVKPAV